MPRFLDVHSLEGIHDEGTLRKLQQSPRDEFGVKHINIFFNRQANICFCLLEAPNREAVESHHEKYSIKCNWITEVQSIE
ncbi:MAG TPA: nickel-binding protein [Nitrososphaeraceae archaeon]|nr:nickel-binding protein [Nitrososphaeraceae archaeon]